LLIRVLYRRVLAIIMKKALYREGVYPSVSSGQEEE
jgi:hypothetical protein